MYMKTNIITHSKYSLKIIALAITLTGLLATSVVAQDTASAGKSEATMVLSYTKNADLKKTATAVVKVKNKEGKFVAAKNAHVNFYVMDGKELKLLKTENSDKNGQAVIQLPKDLPLNEELSFNIVAKIENDPLYADVQEQMHYKDANLTVSLNPRDTSRVVTAKITQTGKDGKEIPVKGIEVKFYVQRMFGNMPAAEDYAATTEENGEATFTYPKNIPGDKDGNMNVVAKIEDNEQLGNIETKAGTYWGKALAVTGDPFPRALWEPYAPLPLVIVISTLFGGVWCTYFFIFFQLRKIKTESKLAANN